VRVFQVKATLEPGLRQGDHVRRVAAHKLVQLLLLDLGVEPPHFEEEVADVLDLAGRVGALAVEAGSWRACRRLALQPSRAGQSL
jgi:hypothetical protein